MQTDFEGLINELLCIGHVVSEIEKKRMQLRGLTSDLTVTAQVITSTRKTFTEALVSTLLLSSTEDNFRPPFISNIYQVLELFEAKFEPPRLVGIWDDKLRNIETY